MCGEVLIDILPTGPVVGGGPANTAKALAVFAGPPPTTGPVGKMSIRTSPHTQILIAARPCALKIQSTLQHLTNDPALVANH